MAKVIVDYNEEGTVTILSDSEDQIDKIAPTLTQATGSVLIPMLEETDDVDMKPDDTLDNTEEEDEEEGDGENV